MSHIVIGGRIKELRRDKGWTLLTLAQRAGIGKSTLYYLECCFDAPQIWSVYKVAKALGVSVEYLLTGEEYARKEGNQEETYA
jgi:transcriptional regulator with XRE-family HTH domain